MSIKRQLILLIAIFVLSTIAVEYVNIHQFSSIVKRQKMEDMPNLIHQIENNVLSYLEDIDKIALSISYNKDVQNLLVSDDKLKQFELYNRLSSLMTNSKSLKDNIDGISVVSSRGTRIAFNAGESLQWVGEYADIRQPVVTSIREDERKNADFHYYYIVPIFDTESDSPSFTKIGTLVISLNVRQFANLFQSLNLQPNSRFMILDSNSSVVASNDPDILYMPYEVPVSDKDVSRTIKLEDTPYIYTNKTIEALQWEIISLIPLKDLTKGIHSVTRFVTLAMLIVLAVMVAISMTIFVNITKSIRQISNFTSKLGIKNVKQRLYLTVNNELKPLMTYINSMLDHKEEMTERLLVAQEKLFKSEINIKQAELKYLQSQINPHFLYNTLECIRSIAVVNKAPEIGDITVSLSSIFRYSINASPIVSLKEELECINHYFRIIEIRYRGRFSLEIITDEKAEQSSIQKMLLQPLIENAVYHGLETRRGTGMIRVEAQVTPEGAVVITVEDNGSGIEPRRLETIMKSLHASEEEMTSQGRKSLGLVNIHRRIINVYGNRFGLILESEPGQGTTVTLTFPNKAE